MTTQEPNLLSAVATGSVPRGKTTIYDQRTKNSIKDEFMDLIFLQQSERSGDSFIRTITITQDNTAICLFSDEQAQFLLHHCTSKSDERQPVHVDVTFNVTDMFLLVMTMRAPMFEGNPLLVGPMLLTKRQRASDYAILWKELVSKVSELENEQIIFITDGEEAVIKSLEKTFTNSLLFRCTSHLKDNIRRKLTEIGIPSQLSKTIIADIDSQFLFARETFSDKCLRSN